MHEIALCHFDLGSFAIVNVPLVDGTAAFLRERGLRGVLEVGLEKRCELVDVVDDGMVLWTVVSHFAIAGALPLQEQKTAQSVRIPVISYCSEIHRCVVFLTLCLAPVTLRVHCRHSG